MLEDKKSKAKKPAKKKVTKSSTSKSSGAKKATAKKPVTKKAVVKKAVKKKTTVKKSAKKATAKKPVTKRKAATKKTATKKKVPVTVRSGEATPTTSFEMPDIILPEVIEVQAAPVPEHAVLSKPEKQHISFFQKVVSITAVIIVGLIAMYAVTEYYQVTISNIESNYASSPVVIDPIKWSDRTMQTDAGRITITFPEFWKVQSLGNDHIRFVSNDNEATTTIQIHKSKSPSVLHWLQQQSLKYTDFEVIELSPALKKFEPAVFATAIDDQNNHYAVFYVQSGEYVIESTIQYLLDSTNTKRNVVGYTNLIENLKIE